MAVNISTAQVEVNGQTKTVQRLYKDLQWLHRNLSRRMELGGYIVRARRQSMPVLM